jgi:hypothetical protein
MLEDRVLSRDIRLVAMLLAPKADARAALVEAVKAATGTGERELREDGVI